MSRFDFHYGKMGSAKTKLAVYKIIQDYLEGRIPISNIHLLMPRAVYVEPKDIISSLNPKDTTQFYGKIAQLLNNSDIPKTLLLDEIGKWWDGRSAMSQLNRFLAYFVDQCRKRNINIIVTDQHITGLDLRGRDSTDKLVRCFGQYYPDFITDSKGREVPYKFHFVEIQTEYRDLKPPKSWSWRAEDTEWLHAFYKTEEIVVPAEIQLMEMANYG